MDTKTFLTKVLDSVDNYVLYLARDAAKWNENHSTVEEACEAIAKYDQTPTTVYFAIGKFKDNVELSPKTGRPHAKRKKEFASSFKTLCCDIDVGATHIYKTQKDAAAALLTACNTMKLPHPMLVSSGVGVHAYWPLTEATSADEWEAASVQLRAALHVHNVDIDASKIHDRSMVLRPAGSHHKKDPANWRDVKVVYDQPAHALAELVSVLSQFAPAAPAHKPRKLRPGNDMLDAVLSSEANLKLDDLQKCNQIATLLKTAGKVDISGTPVSEPLWRASLGIAKYCVDQQEAIIRLAGGHPDFDLAMNMKKLDGWKGTGPTTCATFRQLCPEGCVGCKHDGLLTSPAQLIGGVTEVEVVHPVTQEQVVVRLPRRYSFKNKRVVYTPAGSEEDIVVSPYMMYVVARFSDVEERHSVTKIAVEFPVEGTKIIDIETTTIATGGTELAKALALKQVYTYGDNKYLRQYLMTYLRELQQAGAIDYFYKHFGWQKDGTFLAPEGIIGKPRTGHVHFDAGLEPYREHMQPTGDLQEWIKGTKLFDHPELKYHGFVFMAMGGSILMKGSGLASAFVNMYSKDSGSGKTLTARYGLSMWGKPSQMMRTVNDTDNALYKRFGLINSLGAYIDEVTTMEVERMRNFLLTIPEGREKDRLRQAADGFRDMAFWNMLIFGSSNRDINDLMGTRYSSEAEKLRAIQFPFDRVALFEKAGINLGYVISRFLENNYGMVGPMVAAEIMRRGGPDVVFNTAFERLLKKYGAEFTGQERFWQAVFVCAEGFNEIATSLKLIAFDGDKKMREALAYVPTARAAIQEDAGMSSLDYLMQFLTEHADKIVHWREAHLKTGLKQYIIDPVPRTAMGRSEIAYDDNGTMLGGSLYINRASLRKWCTHNGAEYRSILTNLAREGVKFAENVRRTLFKGVPGATVAGQTYCLALDLASHPRLIEASSGANPSPINCTPRLSAVK